MVNLNRDIKIKIFELIPCRKLCEFWLKNKNVCTDFILENKTSLMIENLVEAFTDLVETETLKEIDEFLDAFHTILDYRQLRLLDDIYVTEEFALKWRHFIPMKEWCEFVSISDSFILDFHSELSMFDLYLSNYLSREIIQKYYLEIKEGDWAGGGWGGTGSLEFMLATWDLLNPKENK